MCIFRFFSVGYDRVGTEPAQYCSMAVRFRVLSANRWVSLVVLQIPALLLLQSCNKDKAEPSANVGSGEQSRAVFGSGVREEVSAPQSGRPGTPETAGSKSEGGQPERLTQQEPQQRARSVAESKPNLTAAPGSARSTETRRSQVGDPGELRARDERVTVARDQPTRDASGRYLYYQAPGSKIGDSGEVSRRTTEQAEAKLASPPASLIRRWAATLISGDLDSHMRLYAPTLDRFRGSRNLRREVVRSSKQQLVSVLAGVRRFEIYDVKLRSLPDSATRAEFRIESDAGNGRIAGWYRLDLRQINGEWKIVGEEKLQSGSVSAVR